MAQFVASSPRVEVNGETVLSIVAGMGAFKSRAIQMLSDNGIAEPQPGRWYQQQSWLNAFKQIAEKLGATTLTQIGKAVPENAAWPPDVNTLEKALASIDVAYHMNHRGGEIGHYKCIPEGDRKIKIVCDNPYPCAFDRGIITAVTAKFKPDGVFMVKVDHDETNCRSKGGNACTYTVSW